MTTTPATPSPSTAAAIDDYLLRQVFIPWQESCQNALLPWEATPELRAKWSDDSNSDDPVLALGGTVALSRCSNLSELELQSINGYFLETLELPLSQSLIVSFLLSGGTPPAALLPTFFNIGLCADSPPPTLFWNLFARFLRHPCFFNLADFATKIGLPGDFVSYSVMGNPSQTSLAPFVNQSCSWFRALSNFRMPKKHLPETAPTDELESLAILLRTDLDQSEFKKFSRGAYLNEEALFVNSEHPCLLKGPAPSFNPMNPYRETIEYFGTPGLVCSIWRHYNPLLCYPWMMETVSETEKPGVYMALALLGMPVFDLSSHPAYDNLNIRGLLEVHPSAVFGRMLTDRVAKL